MVKFKVFDMRELKDTVDKQDTDPASVKWLYDTTHDFYAAVAEFASSVDVVSISGSPWGEDAKAYMNGEVVVWYRE